MPLRSGRSRPARRPRARSRGEKSVSTRVEPGSEACSQPGARWQPNGFVEIPTMRRTSLTAFVVLLAAAIAVSARADDLEAARKAIEAQYARLDAATARKDPSPLDS